MSLLFRYVFSRHARLLLLTLGVGLGLYLLTDIIERVDIFVESGVSVATVALYFLVRLPSIAAQILPAVFILASVITLCLMARSRESMSLAAGGVPPQVLTLILVLSGLFWGLVQLGLSQFLGTAGLAQGERIWQEEVRKRDVAARSIDDLWFMDGDRIVAAGSLRRDGQGTDLSVYELSAEGDRFTAIIRAPRFTATPGGWEAFEASRFIPERFISEQGLDLVLPIRQDPSLFFVTEHEKPQELSLWHMSRVIRSLGEAGSNVEGLVTAWHARLAYAASLMIMAVLAAAVVSWRENIYLAVGVAIALTFVFYVGTVLGQSMGERGMLPPIVAAWGPQALMLLPALARLYYVSLRR